jgi:hypothetical protein
VICRRFGTGAIAPLPHSTVRQRQRGRKDPERGTETMRQQKSQGRTAMRRYLILAAILCTAAIPAARAQVDLSTYADANGFLDVQKLTCAQLAGTWQGDADRLTTWYSGWYNGLARKHFMDIRKGKEAEHEVIVYCKANPDQPIIEAIAVVFKDMRARLGIEMKP